MKKLKFIKGDWLKKIKNWGLVKMINYKNELKTLNDKIKAKNTEIQELQNLLEKSKVDQRILDVKNDRITSLEDIVDTLEKTSKENFEKRKEAEKQNEELLTKIFNLDLEIKNKNVEVENYKLQIEDLKSDRYLVRKIPSGRTKNTIKTKISKPMSANVTKYMRGEHE